jgi:hypothetical protein
MNTWQLQFAARHSGIAEVQKARCRLRVVKKGKTRDSDAGKSLARDGIIAHHITHGIAS